MNRVEFMGQLERLLWDIPESDRLDALRYYNDYFDEAGPENEAQVIQKLGSPGKVAATIKADLNLAGNQHAEYTERGYYDGRENTNPNPPAQKEKGYHEPKQKRQIPLALVIVLLVFASPILLGVGGGLLGGLLGLLGGLAGLIIAVVACGAAFVVAGIVCFVVGIVRLIFSPLEGLVTTGIGSLLLAAGILLLLLFAWCIFKWIPALFRACVDLCYRIFHRGERRSKVWKKLQR